MALVFMNLLLGLAVSDIGELVRTFLESLTSCWWTWNYRFCKKFQNFRSEYLTCGEQL